MSGRLVLDTHAALWWSTLPERLSKRAGEAIAAAEELLIPSLSLWETALLVRKGRVQLDVTVRQWAEALRSIPRVRVVSLGAGEALLADSLTMHGDPVDRFIVATALRRRVPLVSKDALIRESGMVPVIW